MTPTIVLDGDGNVAAVAGASGGPRIITATTQVLLNALVYDRRAEWAVAAPRVHHQWSPDKVYVEQDRMKSLGWADFFNLTMMYDIEDWRRRGHTVEPTDQVGNVQLIKRTPAGWEAACDPRKGGRPAGY
jgi:gamma-glutamyltranspeptidase